MEKSNPVKLEHCAKRIKYAQKATGFWWIILLAAIGLSISGCATFTDYDTSQERSSDSVGVVDAQNNAGQTFISRRPRLSGITIWITPVYEEGGISTAAGQNLIILALFHNPEDVAPLFTTTIVAPDKGTNLPVYIKISGTSDQPGQAYYLLMTKKTGTVQINGRNEDAYPQGQAYANGLPIQADIAFRLNYDYDIAALLQDIRQGLAKIWLVMPLLILTWLPGWLLLEFAGLQDRLDFGEKTGMAIGISLALTPVLLLWTTIGKIRWTRAGVLFCAGFLVALFVVRMAYKLFVARARRNPLEGEAAEAHTQVEFKQKPGAGITIALLIIFAGTLAIRLIMIRDIVTPAWVDSIHHGVIARLILSSGAYPASYLPFLDFPPPAYHPGFHSLVATFTWLTDLSLEQSMLILGQVLNALLVFTVYLLGKSLSRKPAVGLIAAAITGFMTPMPAYYTSWGRYTELSGLLILPAAFVLIQSLTQWQTKRQIYWSMILGALAAGGLFMVHYRVILFLSCLLLSFLIVWSVSRKHNPSLPAWKILLRMAILCIGGMGLVFPWLFEMLKGTVIPLIKTSVSGEVGLFQDFSWAYLMAGLGKQSLVLAGLGLVWGMIKRLSYAYVLAIWTAFLFMMANSGALHLPGGNLINNTSVEIMLFVPISILGGYFIYELTTAWKVLLPQRLVTPFLVITALAIGCVALTGARQLATILNPVTILSREADLAAIEWIKDNIPEGETIVINPFAWGYGVYAGNDGGYWISPLAGRKTLPPPVLYAFEAAREKTNEQSQKVIDLSPDPAAFREFLLSNQLKFIYIGARGGVLSPQKLLSSGMFSLLYQKEGTWIFAVKP